MHYGDTDYANTIMLTRERLLQYYAACCENYEYDEETDNIIKDVIAPKMEKWIDDDTKLFHGEHEITRMNFKGFPVIIADSFPLCAGEAIMEDRKVLDKLNAPLHAMDIDKAIEQVKELAILIQQGEYIDEIYKKLHIYQFPTGLKDYLDACEKFYGWEYRGGATFPQSGAFSQEYRNNDTMELQTWAGEQALSEYFAATAKFLSANTDWKITHSGTELIINDQPVYDVTNRFSFKRDNTRDYFRMDSFDIDIYFRNRERGEKSLDMVTLEEFSTEHDNLPAYATTEFAQKYTDEMFPAAFLDYSHACGNDQRLDSELGRQCMAICKQKGIDISDIELS